MLRDPSLIPLSHDHQRALGLCVLVGRSLKEDGSAENVAEQSRRVLAKFDAEIQAHFAIEEDVLFPALGAYPGAAALIDELQVEHVEIQAVVAAIRAGAGRSDLERFCLLLPAHIRKEEQQLFQQAQQLLSREELARLGTQLSQR